MFVPLTVMSIVNPMDFGANGGGGVNDLAALQAAATALPAAGGLVYLPTGKIFRKDAPWQITKPIKLWSENRGATIFGRTGGAANLQSTRWLSQVGVGTFGVKFTSDATVRGAGVNANQITWELCDLCEAEGNEIAGSEALGFCTLGSTNTRLSYNGVHDVLADHYYQSHTGTGGTAVGSAFCYLWGNYGYGPPGNMKGDDGISFVTYGTATTRNHDAEVWNNRIFDNVARGLSIVGSGPNFDEHDNWCIRTGAAGLYYCSEPPTNDTPNVDNINYQGNVTWNAGLVTPHRGIHIAGDNAPPDAQPFNIVGLNNWSVGGAGGDYLAFNCAGSVTSTGLQTTLGSLPAGVTTAAPTDLVYQDTTVLRTRDTSYAAVGNRPGLYRIHVRRQPGTTATFQQRFEYVVQGSPSNMDAYVATRLAAGDYLSERRDVSGTAYAIFLCSAERTLGTGITAVTFAQMRAGDKAGTLSWLWNRVDRGVY